MVTALHQIRVQSFTTFYNGVVRELITEAFIYPAFNPAEVDKEPPGKKYQAIWDTGATGTVITKKVAEDLNLQPISMTRVHTAGGMVDSPVYIINIKLPSNVGLALIRVSQCDSLGGGTDILIGMDIISLGDFAVTNLNRKTTLSFRFPSIGKIDFVKNDQQNSIIQNAQQSHKIRPNDLCPCGSGKKYKKCCRNKPK